MQYWTRAQEIALINQTQDEYVQALEEIVFAPINIHDADSAMKFVSFNSPTGTGKTKMMAKFINKHPECFFLVTTLSRGHLNHQVEAALRKDCQYDNYKVFGMMQLTATTTLRPEDIAQLIQNVPDGTKVIWFRDEGHIKTNIWSPLLEDKCFKIINMSATNLDATLTCNFVHTMMLRIVDQQIGSISSALDKLTDVKAAHTQISEYNPCALFRIVSADAEKMIMKECRKRGLTCASLVDNDKYNIQELCDDNNRFDVIINKQKIVEGIDIRRAHVIWMEKMPKNLATLVQQVGRLLRNALLWRDDVDILDPVNKQLLKDTRKAYVFYNATNDDIDLDDELLLAFCPYISIQRIKPNMTIYVEDGELSNGLSVMELKGQTGYYTITIDEETGFNVVNCPSVYTEIKNYSVGIQFSKTLEDLQQWLQIQPPEFFANLRKTLNGYYADGRWVKREWLFPGRKVQNIQPIIDEDGRPRITPCDDKDITKPPTQFYQATNRIVEMDVCPFITLQFDDKQCELTGDEWWHIARKEKLDSSCLYQDRFLEMRAPITITNNKLLAVLGCDYCRPAGSNGVFGWIEDSSITSKITRYSKLNEYIVNRFEKELHQAYQQCFTGENNFQFATTLNALLGHCVEDCAKYFAYGPQYLRDEMKQAEKESKKYGSVPFNVKLTRACILKQQALALQCGTRSRQRSFSIATLLSPKMQEFVDTCCTYGSQTGDFLRQHLNVQKAAHTCHVLNTQHLVGIMDACDGETIIDVKVTGCIEKSMIRQVLAYYVLSPAMQGMHIKRVIVYEATTNRFIEIALPEQPNWITEDRCLAGTYKPIQVKLPIKSGSYKFGRTLVREFMHHLIDTGKQAFRDAMPPITVEEAKKMCGRNKKKDDRVLNTAADVYLNALFMSSYLYTDKGVEHACQRFMQTVYSKKSPFYFNFAPSNLGNSRIHPNNQKLAELLHEIVKDLYPKRIDDSAPLEHLRKNFLLYYHVYKELKVFFPLFQYNDNLAIQDPYCPEISRFLTETQFNAIRDKHTVTVTSIPFSNQYIQSVGLKQDNCLPKVQAPAAKQVAAHNQNNYHTAQKVAIRKIYSVAIGRNNGIYFSWDECKRQVHKYQGAKFKSFQDIESAEQFYAQYHNGSRPRNSEYLDFKYAS